MSAYICDKSMFVYLVTAAQSRRINYCGGNFSWTWKDVTKPAQYDRDQLACNDYEKAAEVANMLLRENDKSVSYRYPDTQSEELPGPNESEEITSRDFGGWTTNAYISPDPIQVLKSIECLRYQSCEHPGWEESKAFAFLRRLESAAISALPGFNEALWGAPEKKREEAKVILLSSLAGKRRR